MSTLDEFLRGNYARNRPLAATTLIRGYACAISSLGRYLDRPAGLADLNRETVSAWVESLETKLAPHSAASYRRNVLVLWRAAHDDGLVAEFPRKIRPVKCPDVIIEGFDAAQMAMLLSAAGKLRGRFMLTKIERRLWWRAALLAHWDTALRLSDLLSIERTWIWPQSNGAGGLSFVQSKTGRSILRTMRPETMRAIDACMASAGKRRLIWPLWCGQREFYRAFKRLTVAAGLCGTSKYIRRGSSSEIEKLQPGAGAAHLGHKTAGIFEKHYRVNRIVSRDMPLPPPIS